MKKRFIFGMAIMAMAFSCGRSWAGEKAGAFSLSQESEGIGFDDLSFAPGMRKVLVPGGQTGNLFLIDPDSHKVSTISGFSKKNDFHGGHGEGVTSADQGDGFLFTADRNSKTLFTIDPKASKVVGSAKINGGPDYVRFIPQTHEVWITEPHEEKIEIFSFDFKTAVLVPVGSLTVAGGPESLAVSSSKSLAYTHLWRGQTAVIDIQKRKITAQWPNGCEGSRGIALDDQKGFLFVGCSEGAGVVMDAKTGVILSKQPTGKGVDVIAYNSRRSHLYIPSGKDGFLNIFQVSNKGSLSLFKKVETIFNTQGTVADDHDGVWVGDPEHGQLLFYKDTA